MNLRDLVEKALPGLDIGGTVGKKLIWQLEGAAKKVAVAEIAKVVARGLVKGIDSFARIAVKNLSPAETEALMAAYVTVLQEQIRQLAIAASDYAPLALNVESKKEQFGDKSIEANQARKEREAGIKEMHAEVKDVLLAAAGGEVQD